MILRVFPAAAAARDASNRLPLHAATHPSTHSVRVVRAILQQNPAAASEPDPRNGKLPLANAARSAAPAEVIRMLFHTHQPKDTSDIDPYLISLSDLRSGPRAFAVVAAGRTLADCPQTYLFRNYPSPWKGNHGFAGGQHGKVWEAGRATSAAPTFFDAMVIDGRHFLDGGIKANNPTQIALKVRVATVAIIVAHLRYCNSTAAPILPITIQWSVCTRVAAGSAQDLARAISRRGTISRLRSNVHRELNRGSRGPWLTAEHQCGWQCRQWQQWWWQCQQQQRGECAGCGRRSQRDANRHSTATRRHNHRPWHR